ncbi:pyridoxamine 5'-phosphate oxidase [Mycolicibacter sinensis]|uniref:Pyridoxamine 5'-phosphate oxidase n=2 Tax=Mycolicibacter TaxID=1073531 RepID=A0A1A2NM91_MYCSD|nr:pyridoxamine 5'-phosphate oxidase [Mycolicibacter sinensis]OBI34127.1 pyridoxamine 5'-phosphate oxidase [Mycolicibacter sinensis]
MRLIVESAKLAFVATVCEDGSPNLSPKESLLVYGDDHLVFMHMASPSTVADLRRDPRIEVNVVDFLKRRGYRFKGTAQLRPPGDEVYEWLRQWVIATYGPRFPCREAVLIRVECALPIASPVYMFGDAHEPALIRRWSGIYGLQ